jgi:hypothetical protein
VNNNNKELTFRSRWSWPMAPITTSKAFLALEVCPRSELRQEARTPPITVAVPRTDDNTVVRRVAQSTGAAGGGTGPVGGAAAAAGGGQAVVAGAGHGVVAGGADVVVVDVLRAEALGVVSAPTDLGPRGAASADRMDLAVPAAHPRAVAIETETGPPFSLRQLRVSGNPPS